MPYDFDYYRPTYYLEPQHYTSYTYLPSYYAGDRYYNSYRKYTPLYRTPTTYTTTYANLPRVRNYYNYFSIPDSSQGRRPIYKKNFPSKISSKVCPESEKYTYTCGLNFDSTANDIRSKVPKLLNQIHQYVPRASSSVPLLCRFRRASSCVPLYNRIRVEE